MIAAKGKKKKKDKELKKNSSKRFFQWFFSIAVSSVQGLMKTDCVNAKLVTEQMWSLVSSKLLPS